MHPRRSYLSYRRPGIMALHLGLIPSVYLAAYALRFDFVIPEEYHHTIAVTLPYLLVLRFGTFAYCGLFRGFWRHVSLRDLIGIVSAVSISSALFVAALLVTGWPEGMPRSVIVLDWAGAILLFGGLRFAVRWVREVRLARSRPHGRRSLVIGAGEAGERFLRQIDHAEGHNVRVVGLVDDDPLKVGSSLHGVRVVGRIEEIPRLVQRLRIERLIIAIPSATGEQMRRILALCGGVRAELRLLPSMRELLDGRVRPGEVRVPTLEDLLGREPVTLDLTLAQRDLAGQAVLVTGGGGSIGSELARQIARFRPARLVLFDQAESPLYLLQLELEQLFPDVEVVPIIGDIFERDRLDRLFAALRPDYVFHAAAYKHVPMMEANLGEAVRNNVFGTLRVARAAARHGCRKFVLISTDKAVNPTSIMGATKRIAERVVLGWPTFQEAATDFRVVRFGNVLGSNGSVVPLFRRQLAAGGPLTVTHAEATRYFMTIPEAAALVLEAAALPEASRRIAMLEMGEPVRIVELAENMIRLSGLEPYRDVSIVFTGLRPGEKLREELMSTVEATVPTANDKVRVIRTDEVDGGMLVHCLNRMSAALVCDDLQGVLHEFRALVPQYRPPAWMQETSVMPARGERLAPARPVSGAVS
jgi:FlaA1/EpsC-like NDP-sugar epimerase